MNIAVIFAGGSGVRMGAGIPKQFLEINGKPIIVHTLELFENHNEIDKIYIVMLEEYIPYMNKLVKKFGLDKVCGIVAGGETGQDSIYNGLKKAQSENGDDSIVLIHDGVRPWVSYDTISRNIQGVKDCGNAITCKTDTVKTYSSFNLFGYVNGGYAFNCNCLRIISTCYIHGNDLISKSII